MIVPCKGCKERRVGCHAECERYKEFAQEREAIRADRRKHDVIKDYTRESFVRATKKPKLIKRLSDEQKG